MLRAALSFALSRIGIVRVFHLPTFVSVEPAAVCQLSCPQCPVGRGENAPRENATMPMQTFERILDEVKHTAHTMQFYFQGEPLLNPRLPDMIRKAHDAGLYTIVSTNAQALTPTMAQALVDAGLSRIIVSIDGFSQSSYEAYRRGGSLEKALAGLRAIGDIQARHCQVVLQVLRLSSNEHEWGWIRRHYRELGADRLELKTAQFYQFEQGNPLMPTSERYCRYRKGKDGLYHLRKKWHLSRPGTRICRRLWTGCVFTTTGEVLPCCYDKNAAHSYGNICTQSLADIFRGDKANSFRKMVLNHAEKVDICQNCVQ